MTPDPLHLPAVPGLAGPGSRVRPRVAMTSWDPEDWLIDPDEEGTVSHVMSDGWLLVVFVVTSAPLVRWVLCEPSEVVLDFAAEATRHHALLWLAGRVTTTLRHRAEWTCWPWGWDLCGFGEGERWCSVTYLHPERRGHWSGTPVPTLSDLDPTSDERLPDGSRLVDALALARVVAHVAGVARG